MFLTPCHGLWILRGMAEIVKVVKHIEAAGFQCQMCGWAWIPRDGARKSVGPPRRCPNQVCRTMRWDRTRYPNVTPPDGGPPLGDGARIARLPVIGHPTFARRPPARVEIERPHDALAA